MPVPKLEATPAPRRLLRDIVQEKLLAAIMDGTLEPGERLNDDELVAWLGVSRTPIREAIARLAEWGLVELEANRYTRIAPLDPDVYAEASQFLAGLHTLAITWTTDARSSAKTGIRKAVKTAESAVAKRDPAGILLLLDAYGDLVALTNNSLLMAAELPLRMRVKLLTPKTGDGIDWDAATKSADSLAAAVN